MKHQQAPMLREREQYLSKLHSRGLSLKYIKDTECDLLRLIKALDLCDDSKRSISVEEIRDTVSRIRNCPVSKMHDYGSRGDAGFVSMLILCFSWLDDIGLLDNRYSKTSLLGHLFPNACPRVRIALYPLLDSRISYLEKCKSLLICDRTLKEIALYQLRIIELLGIESGKMVDAEELSDAALKWANMPKGPRHRVYPNDSSHAKFFRMAKNWLSDMGKYQQDEIKYPYKEEIEKYITWIGDEKGLAETTAYARRSELSGFGKYLEEKSILLSDLRAIDIDEYINERFHTRHLGRYAIHRLLGSIKDFIKFSALQGWCKRGICETISFPRMYEHASIPSYIPSKTLQSLVAKAERIDSRTTKRNYAILLLLVIYGFRRSEVANIMFNDIDWENEKIRITHAKTFVTNEFPLVHSVGNAIIDYLKNERNNKSRCEYIFINSRPPYNRMGPGSITNMVRNLLLEENVKLKHYGPHALRHSFATRMINSDKSMKEVADMLGHQKIDNTCIYAKVDVKSLHSVSDMNWEGLL